MSSNADVVRITPAEARAFLVDHLGLRRTSRSSGAKGVRELLGRLRCIQLDPLDAIGTNADLVALARVDGIARGDVYRHLLPGHAFEHFAKERCILPASTFVHYRAKGAETLQGRLAARLPKLTPEQLQAVLDEVRERGPLTAQELTDQGRVEPIDWSGWKGTARATQMAIEVLWARCDVVVTGRRGNAKVYDVPERALASGHIEDGGDPALTVPADYDHAAWAVVERVHAAGLLALGYGMSWSVLGKVRRTPTIPRLLAEGKIASVVVEGATRRYLAPAGIGRAIARYRAGKREEGDGRVRILGPLDPIVWDRVLVRHVFDFEYVWEVYKPASARRWGWYVCPLLHGEHLVGRIEAVIEGDALRVKALWGEPGRDLDAEALREALERHAAACGASRVRMPRGGVRRSRAR